MQTYTIQDSYGESYTFNLHRKGTPFPAIAGVYIFLKENSSGLYDIIYIGQTSSFKDRIDDDFTNHTQYECIKNKYTHIATLDVPREQQRLDIERRLIRSKNTSCNEQ